MCFIVSLPLGKDVGRVVQWLNISFYFIYYWHLQWQLFVLWNTHLFIIRVGKYLKLNSFVFFFCRNCSNERRVGINALGALHPGVEHFIYLSGTRSASLSQGVGKTQIDFWWRPFRDHVVNVGPFVLFLFNRSCFAVEVK